MNKEQQNFMYDTTVPQTAVFSKEDDSAHYQLSFSIQNLPDADLIEVERLTDIRVESKGDTQTIFTNDLDAYVWFFNEKVLLVGGFEGELPENWRDEFTLIEKEAIAREFLRAQIWIDNQARLKKNFTFGNSNNEKKVLIKAFFDGREILCEHVVKGDVSKYSRRFKNITTGIVTKKGKTGMFLPETLEKLGSLYDEIGVTYSNYNGEPPIHHKVLVVRELFGDTTEAEGKKLNR